MRVKKFDLTDLGTQLDNKMEEFKSGLRQDAKDREERLAQDAREREQRAQAIEERLMADRRESEARFDSERKEFRSQKRWLIANFVGVAAIIFGFFLAVIGLVVAVGESSILNCTKKSFP